MQIISVQAIPVSVPRTKPFASSLGAMDRSNCGVIVVTTDEGIVGAGEVSLIWHGDGTGLCAIVNDRLGPAIQGTDPFSVTRFHQIALSCLAFGKHSLTAIAGVEMALFDIQGKAVGQPVYNLLGGRTRDRVPLSMSLPMDELEATVALAENYVDRGFHTLKVKVGLDREHDIEVVREVPEEVRE